MKQDYLASADSLVAQGDFRTAIVEYRNALALDGQFPEARQKLARALLAAGAIADARTEFVRAADLMPSDVTAQLDAGRILLRVGQFEDAKARADRILLIDPKSVDALVLRASATANLRDPDNAISDLQEAIALDPSRSSSLITLGNVQAVAGDGSQAEAAFERAVALDPSSATPRLALANYQWATGRRTEAERSIRDALAAEPQSVVANRALAYLLVATGRASEAEQPLRTIVDATSDLEPRLVLADYYIAEDRPQEARKILETLSERREAFAAAQVRLAAIAYGAGDRDQAYQMVDQVLERERNNTQVRVVKGGWLLGEGRLDEALTEGQAAVAGDPRSPGAQSLLGAAHQARRELPQAIQAFTEVLSLDPRAFNAQMALAEAHLASGDPTTAVRYAEEAVQTRPRSAPARLLLTRVLIAQNRVDRADAALRVVAAETPDSPEVQSLAGQIRTRQGRLAEARASFEHALRIDPANFEAVSGLVALDLAVRRGPDATRRADAAVASQPDDVRLLLLAGRTHAIVRDFERAETLLRKALEQDAGSMQAYHLLGQIYVAQERLDQAREEYEAMVGRQPDNVAAHTMVAMILQVQNNWPAAKAQYQKILSIDPRAAVAANNLAYMHAEEDTDLNVALTLAQTAKAALPDEPDVNDTLGWVYYKRDMASLAVPALEQAVKAGPSNPLYRFHLGMAYVKAGDAARGRAELEQALKLAPNFDGADEARRALAAIGR